MTEHQPGLTSAEFSNIWSIIRTCLATDVMCNTRNNSEDNNEEYKKND